MAKKLYELMGGKHFGRNEKGEEVAFSKGDFVQLTEEQYGNFKDKFKVVTSAEAKASKGTPVNPSKSEEEEEVKEDPKPSLQTPNGPQAQVAPGGALK